MMYKFTDSADINMAGKLNCRAEEMVKYTRFQCPPKPALAAEADGRV